MRITYSYQGERSVKTIDRSEVLIGRLSPLTAPDLDLGRDSTISRKHARLRVQDGECWVEDLNSTNGTLVDGVPVAKERLRPESQLILGDTVLEVEWGGENGSKKAGAPAEAGQVPPVVPASKPVEAPKPAVPATVVAKVMERAASTPPSAPAPVVAPAAAAPKEPAPRVALGPQTHVLRVTCSFQGQQVVKNFDRTELTVGRLSPLTAPDVDLVKDSKVSRKHSRIKIVEGECWVEDLQSTNGTFVDGELIDQRKITAESLVQIGDTILMVEFKPELLKKEGAPNGAPASVAAPPSSAAPPVPPPPAAPTVVVKTASSSPASPGVRAVGASKTVQAPPAASGPESKYATIAIPSRPAGGAPAAKEAASTAPAKAEPEPPPLTFVQPAAPVKAGPARPADVEGRFPRFAPRIQERLAERAGQGHLTPWADQTVVTALVVDLVGFKAACFKMKTEDVAALVTEYLTPLREVIFQHGGAILNHLGDSIVAVFGSPEPDEHQQEQAIKAARAIQMAVAKVNLRRTNAGQATCQASVALHSGEVFHGFVGSDDKLTHLVVGDLIPRALLYSDCTPGGDVLMSPEVYQKVFKLFEGERVSIQNRENVKLPAYRVQEWKS